MTTTAVQRMIAEADRFMSAGKLADAKELYGRICQMDANLAVAWRTLGAINGDLGQVDESVTCLRTALQLDPLDPEAHLILAHVLRAKGSLNEAREHAQEATRLDADHEGAWLFLSGINGQLGFSAEAEDCARRTIDLWPDCSQAYINLGYVQYAQGRFAEAEEALSKGVRLGVTTEPGHAEAWSILGNLKLKSGDFDGAAACHRSALELNPQSIPSLVGAAIVYQKLGNLKQALQNYREALRLDPRSADTCIRLGDTYHALDKTGDAVEYYKKALQIDPTAARVYVVVGDLLLDEGKTEEGCEYYRKGWQLDHRDSIRAKLVTAWPVIIESSEHLARTRKTFSDAVDALMLEPITIDDPATEVCRALFYPVYGGLNDLDLQLKTARLYEKACPALLFKAPHCRPGYRKQQRARISIGFVSRFFCTHTIGSVMKGLIQHLSRDLFEVTVFTFPHERDEFAKKINACADHVVILPMEWKDAHRVIAETEMDILLYTDIGMEPYTYFLAYARLAPIQCATWGHPVTSGIRNIDYYLSCEDFEPPDAEQHYSEKLIRLGSPPTYYERPQLPRNAKARADYPWDADKHLYFCPQTLFKFHPDFDEALGNILRRDQDGQVVLINSRHQHWLDLLLARFHRSIPDVVDRIVVLPFQSPEDYLNLLHKCDVILDTFHFVGGSSSLQALGLGTPIVTLPGQYQRGRFTFSYYKAMKYLECVANDLEDYVRIAVQLGTDPEYRRRVSEQITARNNILYENISVVREIERFLVNAVGSLDAPPSDDAISLGQQR